MISFDFKEFEKITQLLIFSINSAKTCPTCRSVVQIGSLIRIYFEENDEVDDEKNDPFSLYLEKIHNENDNLIKSLNAANKELYVCDEALGQCNEELNNLKKQLEIHEKSLRANKKICDDKLGECNEELKNLREQLEIHDKTLKANKKMIKTLRKEKNISSKKLSKQDTEIIECENEIEELNEKIEQLGKREQVSHGPLMAQILKLTKMKDVISNRESLLRLEMDEKEKLIRDLKSDLQFAKLQLRHYKERSKNLSLHKK